MKSQRYSFGWETLKKVDGKAGEKVVDSLKDIAPEFSDLLVENFGDIYGRKQLDLKSREIATIAALTVLGNAQSQLKVHIHAGLNVGLSKDDIVEIIMQMAMYGGYPCGLNGLFVAKEVFDERY